MVDWNAELSWIIEIAKNLALNIIFAAVILIVGFKLTKKLSSKLQKRNVFGKLDSNIASLIQNSIRIAANSLIVIIAIQILGVPSATIIAVLGSCGLAIGLALQGGLSNLAGGVMIMIFKPFHAGDYICTAAGDGTVEDIGVFYTKLSTVDNRSINIPNSILSSTTVTNLSAKPTRGIDIDVSVAYGTDLDLAKRVLIACAEVNPLVFDDPAPKVFVSAQEDSSIKLKLRVFVKKEDYWQVRFELTEDSVRAFAKAGVEIPFPQLDVHMK